MVPPSTGPPKLSCAICGNSARGMPKIIAIRSTTNDISTTCVAGQVAEAVEDRARSPTRERACAVPVGGIGASRNVAQIGANR